MIPETVALRTLCGHIMDNFYDPHSTLIYLIVIISKNGGRDRIRTCDRLIKSQMLYRLSYAPL